LAACLGALTEDDEFGIIAFDDRVEAFGSGLHKGDKASRDQAQKFLESVDARGGTELGAAVSAAVKVLGGSAGDVLIMTDGASGGYGEHPLGGARRGSKTSLSGNWQRQPGPVSYAPWRERRAAYAGS